MLKLSTMSLFILDTESISTTFGQKWPKMIIWAQTVNLRFWTETPNMTIFNSFSLKMLSWVILGNIWSKSSKLTIWAQNNMFDNFWPKVAKIDYVSKIKPSQFGYLILAKDAITRWHSPAMVISVEIGQKSRPLTFGSKMPFSVNLSWIWTSWSFYDLFGQK